MREVVFTVDFATKVKGEKWVCDSILASHLVNVDEVAQYSDEAKETKKEKKSKD